MSETIKTIGYIVIPRLVPTICYYGLASAITPFI